MTYYIKEGQNSIFQQIKIKQNQCEIRKIATETKSKKIEKLVKNMKKKKVSQVVISKQLKQNEEFIRQLNNYDITILEGKWLMQYILIEIIKNLQQKRKETETDEIAILANDLTTEVQQNIKMLTKQYKKIRIITNHSEKYKRLEQELYEEKGIPIIITNNKRKALSKSILIINFDFVQECINQYNINENATIINLSEQIRITKKRFSGTIITDYEVKIQKEAENSLELQKILEKQKEFSLKEIIEEKIYNKIAKSPGNIRLKEIEEMLEKYNIKIKDLYGINGKI